MIKIFVLFAMAFERHPYVQAQRYKIEELPVAAVPSATSGQMLRSTCPEGTKFYPACS